MQVYTKIIVDIETDEVLASECLEYLGPLAECISFGGSKSKSKQQSQQQSSSESGTRYNEGFLTRALDFAGTPAGKQKYSSEPLKKQLAGLQQEYDQRYKASVESGRGDSGLDPLNDEISSLKDQINYIDSKGGQIETEIPGYDPKYVRVAPEGFDKLENTLYGTQESKLRRAYEQAVGRQREELAQSGALNSPSQFLEGSARSSLDRSYIDSLQQAARDAFMGRLGLEEREAGRETAFNEQTAARLLDLWLKKIGIAAQSGQYSKSQGSGTSSGSGSGSGFNFGLFNFGGSQSSNSSTS